jgi:amino acid transporter
MGHWLALTLAAVVILSAAAGTAFAYPSHAYQTAATSGELATVHTYCMTVGSFASVSPPWRIERRWPLRIGVLGAGIVLAVGLLTAAKRAYKRRLKPIPT